MSDQRNDSAFNIPSGVPQYVLDYAPIVRLFSKDPYRPSSIESTLQHTTPQIDFKQVNIPSPPLTLRNLDQLNNVGSKGGTDVYLTSVDDVTKNPKWLEGEVLNEQGGTNGSMTGVIAVVDKGEGRVDAFYFYYFVFNWGGVVLNKQLGDHVGDWEHNMIRFEKGVPKYVWYSQHANGEAFTYEALEKSGKRPIAYCANGSHALFPTTGSHDHTIPNLNLPNPILLVDQTDKGPLYDPLLSSYFYAYNTPQRSFTPYNERDPTQYLYFKGRWGDQEYPESDPRQKGKNLFSFKKYVGGPTGPADKQLDRKEVWPENSFSKGQRIRNSIDGKTWWKDWVSTWSCFGKKQKVTKVTVSGETIN